MPAEFDPYYTWLGIPPEEQPPHHYRLLGIRALEADRDVITHAMDQRMAHLRTLQSGKHSADSQRLLNEVSAAAVVLLDPAQKAAYDAALQQQLAPRAAAVPPAVPPPIADVVPPPPVAGQAEGFVISQRPPAAIIGGIGVLLLIALTFVAFRLWPGPVEVAEKPTVREKAGDKPPVSVPPTSPIEHSPPDAAAEKPSAAPVEAGANPIAEAPNPPDTGSSPPAENQPEPPQEVTPAPPMPLPTPAAVAETPTAEPSPEAVRLPTAEEIEAAQVKVIEIFGGEARQAARPEQKLALAQRMSQVASETNNDLAVRYALLDAARKLYSGAGEVDLALATVVALADEFEEDGWELRLSTFTAMSDAPLPTARRDHLASVLVMLVDQAVAEEEFASADEFARLAVKVGNRSSDVNVRRLVVQKRSELTRLKDMWQAVEQARGKLEADANDPVANLVVGKFLCFVVADFEQGIPHLVRSGREPFAAAALADQLAAQGPPEEAGKAGDSWYALAESVKTSDKELVAGALLRARHWYQRVVPQLSGLDKARIEKRIQETNAIAAAAPRSVDSGASAASGKVKKGKRGRRGM